ncbi:MAG TPA: hypothetical protein VNJ01_00520 [Bacteriovoracaceae bacterium]|nr:hypothetical protein [Bacteriovoracaceae bacterium]
MKTFFFSLLIVNFIPVPVFAADTTRKNLKESRESKAVENQRQNYEATSQLKLDRKAQKQNQQRKPDINVKR